MVAVAPRPQYGKLFDQAGGAGKPRYGQLPVCYGADEESCQKLAHEQWRWGIFDWKVNSELPNPTSFDSATRHVRPEDLAERIPCGPDVAKHVAAARAWADAGFTHLAFVQVGGAMQDVFIDWAQHGCCQRCARIASRGLARPR
jgi:hypothetical protein